jgi:hypothetical protein
VVQHPRIGQVILEQAAALKDAVPIILHHHERYGGHGYPFGLRANEIPLGARIVAVADAYDAMTNDRPYKRAISHVAAIAELRRHAGTQFDPELVESFCDLYSNEPPAPDPGVLAMIADAGGLTAHPAYDGPAIMVPDAVPGRPVRRRRRTDEVAVSQTMGPDGELGLTGVPEPRATRRRLPATAPEGSLSSLPTPGSPRTGRSESATR